MLRRVNTYLNERCLIALAVGITLLALPALGSAASGGGSTSSGAGGSTQSGGGAPSGGGGVGPGSQGQAQSGNRTVTVSGAGITFTTRVSGFLRRNMTFAGSAGRSAAGRTVEIQRAGRQTGGSWIGTASATVGSDGSFSTTWQVSHVGQFAVRAVLANGGQAASSSWPTVKIILYRVSVATIYGPGFWGSRTACGQILHRNTLGVANRTLPCGTKISLYYGGRTIQVPVIDRGPYANGANWDLTEATARALHMSGTERVGAASLPG